MRSTYRVLAMLIAVGVVLQTAFVAWGFFAVHKGVDDGHAYRAADLNAGLSLHAVIGNSVLPLIALVLLILSFFARIPGGVKWAAITFGVMVLQVALGHVGYVAPIIGLLHGINAFALAAVASLAMRQARLAAPAESAVDA
jgi:hypothetical protein